jgi:hypothetical protein
VPHSRELYLEEKWKFTRYQAISTLRNILSQDIFSRTPITVNELTKEIIGKLSQKAQSDPMGPWRILISLIGGTDTTERALTACLERINRDTLDADQTNNCILGTFRKALEKSRIEQYNRPNHRKTWEMIDRISRLLPSPIDGRCTREHMIDVLVHIKSNHQENNNLPKTLTTLEEYFIQYCGDCWGDLEIRTSLKDEWIETDISLLADITGARPTLDQCLSLLGTDLMEAITVQYHAEGLWLEMPRYMNQNAYCVAKGITKYEFRKRVAQAQDILRDCLVEQEWGLP